MYIYINSVYVNVQCQNIYIKNNTFIIHELYFGFFQTFEEVFESLEETEI